MATFILKSVASINVKSIATSRFKTPASDIKNPSFHLNTYRAFTTYFNLRKTRVMSIPELIPAIRSIL